MSGGEEVDPDELPPAIRATYERLMAGEHLSEGPPGEGTAADPWIEEEAHEVLLRQQSRWSGAFGRSGGSDGSMARTVINLLVMALCLAVLGLLFQLG